MVVALRSRSARVRLRFAGQRPLGHAVETERRARRVDVVDDERRLPHLLVRRDDEALNDGGIGAAADRHDEVERGRRRNRPEPSAAEGLQDGQRGAEQRGPGQDPQRGNAGVDVGVGRPGHHAGGGRQELRDLQPGAEGQHEQRRGGEQSQVPRRAPRHEHAARRVEPDLFREHVRRDRHRRHQEDDEVQDPLDHLQQRQREHVEADVVSEDRVGLAERRRVQEVQPRFPLAAGIVRDEQRDDADGPQRQRTDARRVHHDRLRAVLRVDDERPGAQGAQGEHEVPGQQREDHDAGDGADQGLRAQRSQEDRLVAELLEPQPVGVERRGRGHAREEEEQPQQDGELPELHVPAHPMPLLARRYISLTMPRRSAPVLRTSNSTAAMPASGIRLAPISRGSNE